MQLYEIENLVFDYVEERAESKDDVENLIGNLQDMLNRVERKLLEEKDEATF